LAHTRPKEGLGTKETGKVSVSLSDITKPFKLGGTQANPSLGISPERAAKTISHALLGPAGWASLFVSGPSGKESPYAAARKIAGDPKWQLSCIFHLQNQGILTRRPLRRSFRTGHLQHQDPLYFPPYLFSGTQKTVERYLNW
jgi:hypothetical protein